MNFKRLPLVGGGRVERTTISVLIVALLGAIAVSVFMYRVLVPGTGAIDLARPSVRAAGAVTRDRPPSPQELARRFEEAFSDSDHWETLTQEQRAALSSQVGAHFAAWMAPAPDELIGLMASWGGKIGTRLSNERMNQLWSWSLESFPIERFNPKQALLTDVTRGTSEDGPTIDGPFPLPQGSAQSIVGTAFDFGEKYQLVDSTCAVITIPVTSRSGATSTYQMFYYWSESKKRWLPSLIVNVTAPERTVISSIVF